jgi:hypothetical protein
MGKAGERGNTHTKYTQMCEREVGKGAGERERGIE